MKNVKNTERGRGRERGPEKGNRKRERERLGRETMSW